MDEAEKKRFHELYDLRIEALRKARESLCHLPVHNSRPVEFYRLAVNTAGFKIAHHAFQMNMMHQAGVLRGWNLEDCMETAFGLLGWFIWVVHQATVNAGPTLARIIQESTTELNNRALELIECTILHGPAYRTPISWTVIPALADKVQDVCRSLIHSPNTNSTAIALVLAQAVGDIKGALQEMENRARRSSGRASTSMFDGKEGRIITEMATHVAHLTVPVIEELAVVIMEWDDIRLPDIDMLMEDLLRTSINMRDRICVISRSVFPLQDVSIHGALLGMEYSVNDISDKLGALRGVFEELFDKLTILGESIRTAKIRVRQLMIHKVAVSQSDKLRGKGFGH